MSLRRWPLTRRALARLRAHASPGRPIRLRSRPRVVIDGEACYGGCFRNRAGYEIRIETGYSDDFAREVLIHEWAHALTDGDPRADEHRGSFGPAWARAYRVAMGLEVSRRPRRGRAA